MKNKNPAVCALVIKEAGGSQTVYFNKCIFNGTTGRNLIRRANF